MTFEDKLRDAFQRAESQIPAEPAVSWKETYMRARRSRFVYRAALAAAAIALIAGGALSINALRNDGGDEQPIQPVSTPTEEPTPTLSGLEPPLVSCSAVAADPTLPTQEGLTPEAAATRQRIADLAVDCDFDGLEKLALAGKGGFSFSFGAGPNDLPAEHWRNVDKRENLMLSLVQILKAPNVTAQEAYADNYEGPETFIWPSAFKQDPSEEDYQILIDLGVIDEQDVADFESFGGYIGYRLSITADGDWKFFVAGD